HDAVPQPAGLPDLGARQDHRALDGGARADLDVLAEHDQAADVRAGRDLDAGLHERRRYDPPRDAGAVGDGQPAVAHALADRRGDIALDDVEGALQIAVGGPDVHPVAARLKAVEPVADQ